jgi:hypothetical protein
VAFGGVADGVEPATLWLATAAPGAETELEADEVEVAGIAVGAAAAGAGVELEAVVLGDAHVKPVVEALGIEWEKRGELQAACAAVFDEELAAAKWAGAELSARMLMAVAGRAAALLARKELAARVLTAVEGRRELALAELAARVLMAVEGRRELALAELAVD